MGSPALAAANDSFNAAARLVLGAGDADAGDGGAADAREVRVAPPLADADFFASVFTSTTDFFPTVFPWFFPEVLAAGLAAGFCARPREPAAVADALARFLALSAALVDVLAAAALADEPFAVVFDVALGAARWPRALPPRALVLALLDFDSSSAPGLSAAGVFPGGLLVTTTVGQSWVAQLPALAARPVGPPRNGQRARLADLAPSGDRVGCDCAADRYSAGVFNTLAQA